jgi:hypothetical protein
MDLKYIMEEHIHTIWYSQYFTLNTENHKPHKKENCNWSHNMQQYNTNDKRNEKKMGISVKWCKI